MNAEEHLENVLAPQVIPVLELTRRVDLEPEHPIHVCTLARMLFLETQPRHQLGDEALHLLEAGALLHDVGLTQGGDRHHKRSRDWILDHGVPGFRKEHIRIIACIARYHRKAHPKPSHAVFADLGRKEQRHVRALAGILRVADGLDRTHTAATRGLRVSERDDKLRIWAAQERVSETDIWGGMRKRALLEEVLGICIEIVPEVTASAIR